MQVLRKLKFGKLLTIHYSKDPRNSLFLTDIRFLKFLKLNVSIIYTVYSIKLRYTHTKGTVMQTEKALINDCLRV